MNISHKFDNHICVLEPVGQIFRVESQEFLEYLESLLASTSVPGMVLNMEQVDAIDSAGIGAILSIRKKLLAQGVRCVLCNLTQRVQEVFHFTRLLSIITVYGTVGEALGSFTESSPSDLQYIIDVWPTLPVTVRRDLLAMAQEADSRPAKGQEKRANEKSG